MTRPLTTRREVAERSAHSRAPTVTTCMTIRCDHPTARCARCRHSDCVHALDDGVCAPCQVRSRSSDQVEDLGPGLVVWSFGGGVAEFIEEIVEGPKAPRRSQWRGR